MDRHIKNAIWLLMFVSAQPSPNLLNKVYLHIVKQTVNINCIWPLLAEPKLSVRGTIKPLTKEAMNATKQNKTKVIAVTEN